MKFFQRGHFISTASVMISLSKIIPSGEIPIYSLSVRRRNHTFSIFLSEKISFTTDSTRCPRSITQDVYTSWSGAIFSNIMVYMSSSRVDFFDDITLASLVPVILHALAVNHSLVHCSKLQSSRFPMIRSVLFVSQVILWRC